MSDPIGFTPDILSDPFFLVHENILTIHLSIRPHLMGLWNFEKSSEFVSISTRTSAINNTCVPAIKGLRISMMSINKFNTTYTPQVTAVNALDALK